MTAPPVSDEARALLDEFAAQRPAPARAEDNWAAVQAKLAGAPRPLLVDEDAESGDDASVDDGPHHGGPEWSRWVVSAAVSVAIAAAVLLALRVVVGAGRSARSEAVGVGTQAADAVKGKAGAQATPRAPAKTRRTATKATAPTETTSPAPAAAPTVHTPAEPARTKAAAAPPEARAPAPSASALAAETKLLVQARTALAEDRFADARGLAARHRREYPQGAMREEVGAIAAIASCRDGQGQDAARGFLKAYPSSPHAPRVRAACPTR